MGSKKTHLYDSKEGILNHLGSLEKFQKLIRKREKLAKKGPLESWIVLGRFRLNKFGFLLKYVNADGVGLIPIDVFPDIPAVLSDEEFENIISTDPGSFNTSNLSLASIPPASALCEECKKPWSIKNCHDLIEVVYILTSPEKKYYHSSCYRMYIEKNERSTFLRTFLLSGFISIWAIKTQHPFQSECYPKQNTMPWFEVKADNMKFVVGRCNSIIYLSSEDPRINFLELFSEEDENVARGKNFIHAWNEARLVEYLKKIYKHSRKPA